LNDGLWGLGGLLFTRGALGGGPGPSACAFRAEGGFGGGGSGNGCWGGGGGGGYSGGGGGWVAGGGGSYNGGASQVNVAGVGLGDGQVLIEGTGLAVIASNNNSGGTLLSTIDSDVLPAGTYFVAVDGASPSAAGRYRLDILPFLPEGDSASSAFDVGDLTTIDRIRRTTDTTCGLANTFDGASAGCGVSTPGRDAIYQFTLTAPRRVTARVDASGFAPRFWIRNATASTTGPALPPTSGTICEPAPAPARAGWSAATDEWRLGPGTYQVVVDTASGCGRYELTLRAAEERRIGDTQATAIGPVDLTSVGVGVRAGSTCDLTHTVTPSCAAGSAPDAWYGFTLTARRRMRFRMSEISPGFRPVHCIRTATAELPGACAASSSAGVAPPDIVLDLDPGTYYGVVDGVGGTCGSYRTEATTTRLDFLGDVLPLPALTGAAVLGDLTSSSAARTGSTLCEVADNIPGCALSGSRDVVYQFTLSARRDIRVRARATSGSFAPSVSIRRAGAPTSPLADTAGTTCPVGTTGGFDRTWSIDPGGATQTYYLVLEGTGGCGTYALDVTSSGITGARGDTFASPHDLGDATSNSYLQAASTTCDLADDVAPPGCGGSTTGVVRRDAVYRFRLTAPRRVSISVPTATGFTPVVSVRAASAPTTTLPRLDGGRCTLGTGVQTYDLGVGATPAAPIDYFVVVDSSDASCGAYQLAVRTTTIVVQADSTALLGTLGELGNLTASSARVDAQSVCDLSDAVSSSCSSIGTGRRDAVYRFTLDAPRRIVATLRDLAGFDGVLSIRDAAFNEVASAAGRLCTDDARGSGSETLTVTLPAPSAGTVYYVVVDSYNGACAAPGRYRLELLSQELGTVVGDRPSAPFDFGNLTTPTNRSAAADASSTCDLADDLVSSCGSGAVRRDAYYRFTLSEPRRVVLSLTSRTTGLAPVVELRRADAPYAIVGGTSCVSGAAGGTANLTVASLAAGTYLVAVDAATVGCGDYRLEVQTSNVGTLGESSSSAYELGPLTTASASVRASSTCELADDHAPGCGSSTGGVVRRDAVYTFTLTEPRRVRVRLSEVAGFRPVLAVRDASFSPIAGVTSCSASTTLGDSRELTFDLPGVPGGTRYYVLVDSNDATCGDYRLDVQSTAIRGDTVATAIPLDLSSGAAGRTGDTTGLTNTLSLSGSAGAGRDAFYSFTLSTPRRVRVRVDPAAGYNVMVGIRTLPTGTLPTGWWTNSGGTGASETLERDLPAGGPYYIQVDGTSSAAGRYTLSVSTGQVRGDTLSDPILAGNLTSASASFEGDTTGLAHDSNACGAGLDGNGPDAFYRFSLDEPRDVRITLTPLAGSYNPVFSVLDASGAVVPGSCTSLTGFGVAETRTIRLEPGTYHVQVDATSGSAGRYRLDIATSQRDGDRPTGPTELGDISALSVARSGSMVGLLDDGPARGPGGASCGGSGSPDAFYRFTLTRTTYLQIDTFGSGADTVLGLLDTALNPLGCNDDAGGGVESAIAGTLPAGTYFVQIDGKSATGGAYTLNVRTRTPDYERADSLAFDLGDVTFTSARAEGSSCQMANDFGSTGSCWTAGGTGTGGDVVLRFRLSATREVQVNTEGSSYNTVVRLLNAAGGEEGCDDDGGAGSGTSALTRTLSAGEYYVVVDSWDSSCGDYRVTVNVVNPSTGGGSFGTVSWADSLAALNARDIDVIVVQSGSFSEGSDWSGSIADSDALCDGTGTVRATPVCPSGQTLCNSNRNCCTGSTRRSSSTRYRYNIASNGTGLGSTIVEAVRDLSQYRRMDISAAAQDNPATPGFDERSFVSSITAVRFAPGRCTGISGGTRFLQCLPGTDVDFQVNFVGAVMSTTVAQTFTFNIIVYGDDTIVLGTIPVTIVVPPTSPAYPSSGSYARDFDGGTECAPTELPVWTELHWTATTPSDTTIRWSVFTGLTLAELDTSTPVVFDAPATASPVTNLQSRLVAAGRPGSARYARVRAQLNPSSLRDLAPTLSSYRLVWSCQPAL
jgi:hypothetical protein